MGKHGQIWANMGKMKFSVSKVPKFLKIPFCPYGQIWAKWSFRCPKSHDFWKVGLENMGKHGQIWAKKRWRPPHLNMIWQEKKFKIISITIKLYRHTLSDCATLFLSKQGQTHFMVDLPWENFIWPCSLRSSITKFGGLVVHVKCCQTPKFGDSRPSGTRSNKIFPR